MTDLKFQTVDQAKPTVRRNFFTCLREEGKVILPLADGVLTISLVISLHRLHTQAQATTFWRCGHLSSLSSTRCMISPSSSGSNVDHGDAVDDSTVSAARSESAARFPPLNSRKDLENFRERKDRRRDMVVWAFRIRVGFWGISRVSVSISFHLRASFVSEVCEVDDEIFKKSNKLFVIEWPDCDNGWVKVRRGWM